MNVEKQDLIAMIKIMDIMETAVTIVEGVVKTSSDADAESLIADEVISGGKITKF